MSYNQILSDLKKKIYAPIYFFQGDEPFYIDQLVKYIEENVLDEMAKDFNLITAYGRDVNPADLALTARGYPMSADYLLVIVKEAQDIRNWEPIEEYIKSPSPTTILVFSHKHKKLDKRKSLYKLLSKSKDVVMFESNKLYDNQIPGWIDSWVKQQGFLIEQKAVLMLADHLGNDLGRIANEIQKLSIILKPGEKITTDHIEKNIGINKDFNIFELTKALGKKDLAKSLQIVDYFEKDPKDNPMQMVVPMLYNYFIKILLIHKNKGLNKFKVAGLIGVPPTFTEEYITASRYFPLRSIPAIVSGIKNLDLKTKGVLSVNSSDYGPLKEFIIKVCS